MSNEHDEIRARYEAAKASIESPRDDVATMTDLLIDCLADIPRLLNVLAIQEGLLNNCMESRDIAGVEILSLRAQLAEKEKEIEPLKKAIFDAEDVAEELGFVEGKYLAEVIREQASRLAERDAENKRLREAVEGIQERASKFLPADFRPGRIGTARGACLWIFNECKGILRRAGEAMEGK